MGQKLIIVDLPKAFDSLNNKLLLTKLQAYVLDDNLVTFMQRNLQIDFNVVKWWRPNSCKMKLKYQISNITKNAYIKFNAITQV